MADEEIFICIKCICCNYNFQIKTISNNLFYQKIKTIGNAFNKNKNLFKCKYTFYLSLKNVFIEELE